MKSFQRSLSIGISLSLVLGLWLVPFSPSAQAMELPFVNSIFAQDDESDDLSNAERVREERRQRRQERREKIRERRKKIQEERQEKRRLQLENRRRERLQKIEIRRKKQEQEEAIDGRQPDVRPEYSPSGERLRFIPVPTAPVAPRVTPDEDALEDNDSLMDIDDFRRRRLRIQQ